MIIDEIIVVEGRDDICAVKRAVDAELIATGGFGFPRGVEKRIVQAAKRKGIIVFTDPDFAGEKIRKKVSDMVPECKHAFLPRAEAIKGDDIGIENASEESIIRALKKVRTEKKESSCEFKKTDLLSNGLEGSKEASFKRDFVGALLGIGYGNAKQFLNRLNRYGVSREEFEESLKKYQEEFNG